MKSEKIWQIWNMKKKMSKKKWEIWKKTKIKKNIQYEIWKKRRFATSWIWNMKNSTDKKRNYFGFYSRQYEIWKLFHIGVKQWKLYFNTYQDSFEKRRKNPNPWILLIAKLLNNPNHIILHFAKLRNNPDPVIRDYPKEDSDYFEV